MARWSLGCGSLGSVQRRVPRPCLPTPADHSCLAPFPLPSTFTPDSPFDSQRVMSHVYSHGRCTVGQAPSPKWQSDLAEEEQKMCNLDHTGRAIKREPDSHKRCLDF